MISPRRARRLRGQSDVAILERLATLLREFERAFDDATLRADCRARLREFAREARDVGRLELPGLAQFPERIDAIATQRDILPLLVPVERLLGRKIRDEDILPRSDRPVGGRTVWPGVLVAENLRSAFNVGGILRTAEFFGAQEVVLVGYTATPEDPKVTRAALGAELLVPWRTRAQSAAVVRELRESGHQILALETGPGSRTLATLDRRFPCALFLGNERHGLSADVLDAADQIVEIPSSGGKGSLNVVTAAGIVLHALREAWGRGREGTSSGNSAS